MTTIRVRGCDDSGKGKHQQIRMWRGSHMPRGGGWRLISPDGNWVFTGSLRYVLNKGRLRLAMFIVPKLLIACVVLAALAGLAKAQTYGGDPPGWWQVGPGSYSNCYSCAVAAAQFQAEEAARQRAQYDYEQEQRIRALEAHIRAMQQELDR